MYANSYYEGSAKRKRYYHMDDSPEKDQSPPDTETGQNPSGEPVEVTDNSSPISAQPADTSGNPRPEQFKPVVVDHSGGKRGLKLLILLIIIALLAGGGWYAYRQHQDSRKAAQTASVKNKDIPLLRIGIQSATYGGVYPDMSVNDYGISVNSQMFEGLVRYEDKSKIVPDLASTWTNPNDSTWIFTIKSGIKFHDGHTMAASDVKASLEKIMATDSDFSQTFASTIASVSLVGKDQVKITTKSPDPTLLNKLAFLYVVDANLPKGTEPSQAGTGPYEIKPGTKPTDKDYQMVAFDGYHFGRPTTRALTFGNQNDNANLIKAFNAGQYDIVGTIAPDAVKNLKNAKLFEVSEADTTFIGFNMVAAGPLQNKQVREAIRYAVNTEAIAKANDEVITPASQLIPPSIPGYNPAISPYKTNIAKAKQLLTQAGYPSGLTIRFSISDADTKEAAEIAAELKQVGITVTIDKHEDFDEFINYFSSGKAEMFTIAYASDTLDGLDVYNTTLSADNYNNPKVTSLLDQANMAVNPATRLKLLQQVSTIVDQDAAVVPFGSTSDLWVMNKDYAIRQNTPTGYIPVYFYTVHLK